MGEIFLAFSMFLFCFLTFHPYNVFGRSPKILLITTMGLYFVQYNGTMYHIQYIGTGHCMLRYIWSRRLGCACACGGGCEHSWTLLKQTFFGSGGIHFHVSFFFFLLHCFSPTTGILRKLIFYGHSYFDQTTGCPRENFLLGFEVFYCMLDISSPILPTGKLLYSK